jgi:hypothetical protein
LALEYGYARGLEGDFTEEQESQFYLDLDKKTGVKLPSAFELEKEIVQGPNTYWYGKYIY